MKFEKTKEKDIETRDAECYRKFLAGNKTLYTQAFWENGPRRQNGKAMERPSSTLLPGVEDAKN